MEPGAASLESAGTARAAGSRQDAAGRALPGGGNSGPALEPALPDSAAYLGLLSFTAF